MDNEQYKEKLVALVNNFAVKNKVSIENTGKRQFVELIEAVDQASCVDEFKLYIRYKGSKDKDKKNWAKLAAPFNDVVQEVVKIADSIKAKDEEKRLELLKLFCGYLMWCVCAELEGIPAAKGAV